MKIVAQSVLVFLMCLNVRAQDESTRDTEQAAEVKQEEFIELQSQSVQLSEKTRTFKLSLGKIRCGKSYEFTTLIANESLKNFTPAKTKSSCSCAAGLIKDLPIGIGTMMANGIAALFGNIAFRHLAANFGEVARMEHVT